MVVPDRQTDVEVGAQRACHLVSEELADQPASDPAYDLADEESLGN